MTTVPPGPASPFKVTVPDPLFPQTIETGLKVKALRLAGVIVSVAVLETPVNVAVIVTVGDPTTPSVVMGKVAVAWFWATITVAGTIAFVLFDVSVTAKPPGPA